MSLKPYLLSNRTKWVITIATLVLYPSSMEWLINYFGPSATTLSVIPVSLIGFLFGMVGGIPAGIFAIIINVLIVYGSESNVFTFLSDKGFLSGCVVLLFVGALTGRLRQSIETRIRKEKELQSRERYLSLLNRMTHSIIASNNPDEMLVALILDLKTLLEADDCYLTRWNDELKKTIPLGTSAVLENPTTI